MKKSEIATYMDAFMEGFWQCYDMMMDMIDDDEDTPVETETETDPEPPQISEKPPVVSKPRTGTNVPEPRNVPHAPERPAKTPMPEVKPTHDQFVELFKQGKLPSEVGKALGVSAQTAYNHLNKAKDKGEL